MVHVQCKGCGRWKIIDGGDVHEAVDSTGCRCCPIDHNHAQATAETGVACRPVIVTLMMPDVEEAEATSGLEVLGLVTDAGQVLT